MGMPDDPDPQSADGENNTPEAPPSRPGPLKDGERMDIGCLLLMMAGFAAIFCLPAFFLLGGAPFIIPVIVLFLLALVTPFINPTEKMADRPRWTGRLVTWLVLAVLMGIGYYMLFMRAVPMLRE